LTENVEVEELKMKNRNNKMGMKYKDEIKEIREVDVKNVKEKTKYYDFVNI